VRAYDATLDAFCIVPMLLLHGFGIVCIDQDPREPDQQEAAVSDGEHSELSCATRRKAVSPVNPLAAKRVWDQQRRPSLRSVQKL
jgi:hypothetical protein